MTVQVKHIQDTENMYPHFYLLFAAIVNLIEGILNLFLMFLHKRIELSDAYLEYVLQYQLNKLEPSLKRRKINILTLNFDKTEDKYFPKYHLLKHSLVSVMEGILNLFFMFFYRRVELIDWYMHYVIEYKIAHPMVIYPCRDCTNKNSSE